MGVHKVNAITGPKTIDKDMEVQDYHMWEVHEVNRWGACSIGRGVRRKRKDRTLSFILSKKINRSLTKAKALPATSSF